MLRFNPNLRWLFTELPLAERYAAAARAGFKGVEVAFPYQDPAKEIAQRLVDNDLTLVQILTPCDWAAGERGIAALPGRESDFRDSVDIAIAYANDVAGRGTKPLIHAMAGNLPVDANLQACHATFLENIAFAADLAARENITIILEPCCTERFPHYFYHRFDEGIAVIDTLARSNLKLCFDTFHIQSEEGALTQRLRDSYAYIGHIQVGDVPGRQEPGTGEIRFPFIFEQIEALGWSGWIGCEFTPSKSDTTACLAWGERFGIGDHAVS
jgi:hydroxypyruvate isomerase